MTIINDDDDDDDVNDDDDDDGEPLRGGADDNYQLQFKEGVEMTWQG